MGSMLKFDSERRALVRERGNARIERKLERRQARERKQSQTAEVPSAPSATQVRAERELRPAVDRIVIDALDRHERIAPPATPLAASPRLRDTPKPEPARTAALRPAGGGERAPRRSRRERDPAYRERRRQTLDEARGEARRRIARAGEPASIADALAALEHPEATPWSAEREQLETAIATGRIAEVGAAARRAMWAISRDAARTSPRRARRDPELALAACVAYAVIARLPRTALRSAQRARPIAQTRSDRQRAFWR
ncbi:MAG: hypothetical protein ACXVWT_23115 [Solirubrobacteraceae bacterium]